MNIFLKATACILITVVLSLTLSKQGKDFSLLLTICVCCIVVIATITFLDPTIGFLKKLQLVGQLDNDMMTVLLKAVGIGLLSEITSLICTDAGNASLGKAIKILASAVILWMSIPLLTSLVELIEEILVAV